MFLSGTNLITQSTRIRTLMDSFPNLRNIQTRINIISYQFGEFVKYMTIYAVAYEDIPEMKAGYEAEAKICMMNMLLQIDLLCVSLGWDANRLRDEGFQHLEDKIIEVNKKGGKII